MPTANPDQVRLISGTDKNDAALAPFLSAAECVLDQVSACMDAKGISEDCQDQAATWLACHMLSISGVAGDTEKTIKKKTFENYTVEFVTGTYNSSGILSTSYGNNANALSGGCLQETDKRNPGICFA